jgi:hypothetical protein
MRGPANVDALIARAASLEVEIAAKARERDLVKRQLEAALEERDRTSPVRRRRDHRAVEIGSLFALVAIVCGVAWGVSRAWPTDGLAGHVASSPHRYAVATLHSVSAPVWLPDQCLRYRDVVERAQDCKELPESARRAFQDAYDQAEVGWTAVAEAERDGLAPACEACADAVVQAVGSTCHW